MRECVGGTDEQLRTFSQIRFSKNLATSMQAKPRSRSSRKCYRSVGEIMSIPIEATALDAGANIVTCLCRLLGFVWPALGSVLRKICLDKIKIKTQF